MSIDDIDVPDIGGMEDWAERMGISPDSPESLDALLDRMAAGQGVAED